MVAYNFLTISLPFLYGKAHFGCPAGKHFLQDKLNWRKDYCKEGIAHGKHIGAPYQIPIVGGGPDVVGGVRGKPCVGCLGEHATKIASWLFDFSNTICFTNRIFSDLRRPPVLLPPLLAAGPLWVPYGKPHFGCPASKHSLQDKLKWRKDYCKEGIAHGKHIGAPYQIPIVGGGPDLVGGVRGEPCVGCLGQIQSSV